MTELNNQSRSELMLGIWLERAPKTLQLIDLLTPDQLEDLGQERF